jgi:hypothetical protein
MRIVKGGMYRDGVGGVFLFTFIVIALFVLHSEAGLHGIPLHLHFTLE